MGAPGAPGAPREPGAPGGSSAPGESAPQDEGLARDDVADGDEDGPVRPSASYARRQNVVAALVPLVIGAIAAVLSWQLGVGGLADPGPGMWPLVVSVAMVVFAAVQVLRSQPTGTEEKITGDALIVVVAVLSLAGYALLFERVGFEIPTVALLVLWLKVLGRESWRVTVALSLTATVAVYLLFITALGVSLPHLAHF
ncbi:tripartite tricarboxylate transporter TctB family protein [Actinomadura rudentiformis]|uniref:Tripartite tricarboxylate transporter TctB family protein n=1 Tax=Actinomadura rudentiformis TaxID=359158 RepID=A0A6H9YLT0_9ACTN|nr:tripartite tricarboxylate transporter TctB family protein [Actinomadura rudentiformis]KAB2340420.1 tripartite tricarboxylate transporter TctB family protein [Actinomadura rudentiformis]